MQHYIQQNLKLKALKRKEGSLCAYVLIACLKAVFQP